MAALLAYISEGKLFIKNAEGEPLCVASPFAESVRERAAQIRHKQEWKYRGPNAQYSCGGARFCSEGDFAPPAYIASISRGRSAGEILYSLHTDEIAGLFFQDVGARKEQRVVHSNRLDIGEIHYSADHDLIACAIARKDGSVNLGFMRRESPQPQPITEGDVIDGAPFWQPGAVKQLLYQSAGIARNAEGGIRQISAISIKVLDVEKGEIKTIREDPRYDFMNPKMSAAGELYFIQKPYHDLERPSFVKFAVDIVCFPFRLLRAVFAWLQFFSIRYTGKPLLGGGDSKLRSMNPLDALIFGNVINAIRDVEVGFKGEGEFKKTWVLKKRNDDGTEVTIAEGVASYDIAKDDSIIYSNGKMIVRRSPNGEEEIVHQVKGAHGITCI